MNTKGVIYMMMFGLIFTPILSARFTTQQNVPLTNDDVLKMLSGQLSENIIIARIEQGPCKFDLSPEALLALKKGGASDHLIEVIIKAMPENIQVSPGQNKAILHETTSIPIPPFNFTAERIKMHIGSEKAVRGTLYNEGGIVKFRSSKGKVQWPARDLLASYENSWKATSTTAFEKEWDVKESVTSTLPDGQKVFFEWNERTSYAGAPMLNVLMMAAAADFLNSGIVTYQPSGGRTEDTLSFRVLHGRTTGVLGMGEVHYSTGKLDVSLKTGTVSFKDSQDPSFSFVLAPSDFNNIIGNAFVSTKVAGYFTNWWGKKDSQIETLGVTKEQFNKSTELIIKGKGKKGGGFFILAFDNKIEGILAPSSLIQYLVMAYYLQ